jgi:hypothetical protein
MGRCCREEIEMRQLLLAILFAVCLAAAAAILHAPIAESWELGKVGVCGLKPPKPFPGLACKDVVAECVCDAKGKNCTWTWRCVPK